MNHIYVMHHNPDPLPFTHRQPLSSSPTMSAPVRSDTLIASHEGSSPLHLAVFIGFGYSNLQPLFF